MLNQVGNFIVFFFVNEMFGYQTRFLFVVAFLFDRSIISFLAAVVIITNLYLSLHHVVR